VATIYLLLSICVVSTILKVGSYTIDFGVLSDNVSNLENIPQSKHFCTVQNGHELVQDGRCFRALRSPINEENVLPYKNKHHGQQATIFCTGPTLGEYDFHPLIQSESRPIIFGVNAVIFSEVAEKVGIDYLFLQDTGKLHSPFPPQSFAENVDKFTEFPCRMQKFYGVFRKDPT